MLRMVTSIDRSGMKNRFKKPSRARRWKIYVAAGLIAYPIVATGFSMAKMGPSTHPSREVFPFFTWSLFSKIMDVRHEYELTLLADDGGPVDGAEADRFDEVTTSFAGTRLGYKALQNVGRGIRLRLPNADEERRAFEIRYFGENAVHYELRWRTYNPLERWRDENAYHRLETLGTFHFEGSK